MTNKDAARKGVLGILPQYIHPIGWVSRRCNCCRSPARRAGATPQMEIHGEVNRLLRSARAEHAVEVETSSEQVVAVNQLGAEGWRSRPGEPSAASTSKRPTDGQAESDAR